MSTPGYASNALASLNTTAEAQAALMREKFQNRLPPTTKPEATLGPTSGGANGQRKARSGPIDLPSLKEAEAAVAEAYAVPLEFRHSQPQLSHFHSLIAQQQLAKQQQQQQQQHQHQP